MEYNKNIKPKNISLISNILVSECSNETFNRKNIIKKYEILQEEDSILIMKKNRESFALSYDQSEINEDEFKIFKLEIKPDKIKLSNIVEKCENRLKNKDFYDAFNDINFKTHSLSEKCLFSPQIS